MPDLQYGKRASTFKKVIKRILATIAIAFGILVLLGLFMPEIHLANERGRRTTCLNNLKQLGIAMAIYADDNKGERPTRLSDFTRYVGGDGNLRLFICPSSAAKESETPPPELISQFKDHLDCLSYDLLSATRFVEGPVDAAIAPVMCDRPLNHKAEGINILFADGHVAWWTGTLSDYARSNQLAITIRPIGVD